MESALIHLSGVVLAVLVLKLAGFLYRYLDARVL